MNKQFLSLLSLCQKAGKLSSGEFSCEKSLQNGSAYLVIISEDASDNTKKKFINKSFYYDIPCYIYGNRDLTSNAIGKKNRASITVNQEIFAQKLENIIKLEIN